MIFNSLDFAIFFPIVFILYWFVFNKTVRIQNYFLLAASYFFYAWWDWRFLSLILISSTTDFIVGKQLAQTAQKQKRLLLLLLSLFINLGMLFYFKYSNFFIENFNAAFTFLGSEFQVNRLNIILPIGISFYTFQTIGYTIDVYRKEWKAEQDLLTFFVFVSFFPQLVAGPIERARNFIPQLRKSRFFELEHAKDGMRQILWGLFLKCVIADQASLYVNAIFGNYENLPGGTIYLGMVYFGCQVYGDFAGYSAIAIGISKLLGFKLKNNFAYPFTSQTFSEIWRRWHISLMNWFRDYVYKSLGGRKKGTLRGIFNIFVVFTLSGLWHGAAWTFVVWGVFTACLITYDFLKQKWGWQYILDLKFIPYERTRFYIISALVVSVNMLACGFFRAPDLKTAFELYGKIFSPSFLHFTPRHTLFFSFVVALITYEHWMRRRKSLHGMAIGDLAVFPRYFIYCTAFILFLYFFNVGQQFIYFQF